MAEKRSLISWWSQRLDEREYRIVDTEDEEAQVSEIGGDSSHIDIQIWRLYATATMTPVFKVIE